MSAKRVRLTPALRGQIIAGIHAGGYPHVAAQAWGVPKDDFDAWLQRGSKGKAREPYRSFANDVRQAQAQARLRAEMTVFEAEPKIWLNHGPGRERDGNPGWSVSVKAAEGLTAARNALLDPELMLLGHALLHSLEPYPEARIQAARALTSAGAA